MFFKDTSGCQCAPLGNTLALTAYWTDCRAARAGEKHDVQAGPGRGGAWLGTSAGGERKTGQGIKRAGGACPAAEPVEE